MGPGQSSRSAQVVRSLMLASLGVTTSSVTHVLAGGHSPTGWGFGLVLAVLAFAAVPLVGGSPGPVRSFSLLAVLQVLAHMGNELAASATQVVPVGGGHAAAAVLAQHGHGARVAQSGSTGLALTVDAGSSTHAGLLPGPGMLVAHTVAALALVLVLTHCERTWMVVVELVRAQASRVADVVWALVTAAARLVQHGMPRPLAYAPAFGQPRVRASIWSVGAPARRGPPRVSVV